MPLVWLGLGLFFVAPPLLLAYGVATRDTVVGGAALLAWGMQALQLWPVLRHHRVPGRYAWSLPLAAVLYAYMTTLSALRHTLKRETGWRA